MSSGWRAWAGFAAAGLFVFFQLILQSLPSVLREGFVADFSLSDAGFGGLSSGFYYPYMLLQIPSGFLVRRFGSRRVMIVGVTLCLAACVMMAFSRELLQVGLARVLMGLGAAPTFVATLALAVRDFPRRYFPMLVAVTEVLGMLGAALGQEVLGFLIEQAGWRTGMAACAWFGAGVLVLIVLLVRDAPNAGAADPRPRGFLPAAAPRVLLAGLAGGMIYSAGLAFAMLWGVAFFQEALGLTLQRASVCASFYSWGIIAGLFVQGVVTSRFRRPVAVMMAGAFGTGVSVLVILYAAPTFWAASVAMLFCGFFSAAYATAFTLVPDAVPREHASVSLGIANMIVIAVGGLVLQPFIGMLAEWQGGGAPKANALVILAVAQAAAMVLLVFLREPRTNPTAAPPRAGVTDSGR